MRRFSMVNISLVAMLVLSVFFYDLANHGMLNYTFSSDETAKNSEFSKVTKVSPDPLDIAEKENSVGNLTSYNVTLVTGDIVYITELPDGNRSFSVIPADPTKPEQSYQVLRIGNDTYVIPSSVDFRKVDLEFFNIDLLIRDGYADQSYFPVIVQCKSFEDKVKDVEAVEAQITKNGGHVHFKSAKFSTVAAELPKGKTKKLFETLVNSPSTQKIWLDRKVKVDLFESVPLIGAPELWNAGYNGSGIEIAILDTGIDDTHPSLDDFDDDPVTVDPKVVRKVDLTDDYSIMDLNGHGTHVAGIAAGTGEKSPLTLRYNREYFPNEWISDGLAMGWHADDASWLYELPFSFPFYGVNYTIVYISSNGLINFVYPDTSLSNSIKQLAPKLAIAPAWDDWRTDVRPGDDIYIWQPDPDHIIIRWQVVAFYDISIEANFQAILGSDGVIQFNYAYNNGTVSTTVGISNGAGTIIAEDLATLNYTDTVIFTPFQVTAVNKGVAPGAWLWNVKVLNRNGWGYWSWVIAGIEYAAYGPDRLPNTGDEADIISMSLGGAPTDGTDPVSLAVDAAVDAGVVVVVAAGNNYDYFQILTPGAARKVITVGASDKSDNLAWFSSRGPTVDLRVKPDVLAPGVNIYSCVPYDIYGTYYLSMSGTSMSTPHVAGAAALMLQKGVPLGWSAPQYVKDALISTAVDLGYDVYTQGGGRMSVPSAAYTQILVDPATVSFGIYGENVLDNATLTFYNLNATSNRILTLNVTVYDILTGSWVDCASFNVTTLDIAAGSRASVLLTINTTVPKSLYGGKIIADIDTKESINAIFGFAKLNTLTINKTKMDGTPAAYESVWIYKTNSTSYTDWSMNNRFGSTNDNGTAIFYVADGKFNIWSSGLWGSTVVWTVKDKYPVFRDVTVNLDETEAVPITFDENKPDQIFCGLYSVAAYQELLSWTTMGYTWTWLFYYPTETTTYITPTSINVAHSYEYYPIDYYNAAQPWWINTPIWHKLFYPEQGVTASISYVADYSELARRNSRYKTDLVDRAAGRYEWVGASAFFAPVYWTWVWNMDIPQSRLEYVSPNAYYWGGLDIWGYEYYCSLYSWEVYDVGEVVTSEWNAHPFSPFYWIYREGDYLSLSLYAFAGDASGKGYWTGSWIQDITFVKIIRNGELVLNASSSSNYFYYWTSGEPTPADYTIIVDGISNQLLSAKAQTILNFTYDAVNDYRPPEISGIYVPGLDLYNSKLPSIVTVSFRAWDESMIEGLYFEYSTDDGATWIEAPYSVVGDRYTAYLGEISNATVSLRISVTDSLGNGIFHTILRAFLVEPPITLADFPAPFAYLDVVNSTVIVGTSDPHGPSGPAHTLDTVGGMGVTAVLGRYGSVADARFYLDTDVAWYDPGVWKVYYWPVEGLTNIITVAGPGVNMITWRYFCNPWYAPVYMYYDGGLGEWVVVTPTATYKSSDWTGSAPLKDLVILEVIYVPEEDRYVLWVGGFGGYATRAGCLALQLFDTGKLPFTLQGKAMLIQWIDTNGNAKVDPEDTWNIVETVP